MLNSKILIKNDKINLSKLNIFLSLKSFFNSDFLLERAEIAFIENNIKDITKVTSIFLPKFINKQLNKVFEKGILEGEFIIPFNSDGSVAKNYEFNGTINKATINLYKNFSIKNLTTKINYDKGIEKKYLTAVIKKGSLLDLSLSDTTIIIKNKNNLKKIEVLLNTSGEINSSKIKKITNLLNFENKYFKEINGNINLRTDINFDITKKFKIKNLSYSTEGLIKNIYFKTPPKKIFKKYLPSYSSEMRLVDTKINFKKVQNNKNHELKLKGDLCFIDKNCRNLDISNIYYSNDKKNNIFGKVNLTNDEVIITSLNYKKDKNEDAFLDFDIDFVIDNYYFIKKLHFEDLNNNDKAGVWINQIKLNNKFEISDIILNQLNNVIIKTYSNFKKRAVLNNNFYIDMNKKITVYGKLFDAQHLLKSLYKNTNNKTFSKNFNEEVKINFDNVLTGTNDNVTNFSMIATINNGSYEKLSLKGNFSNDEIIEMSIYQDDVDTKTLQVISDRARPFVKNFDFIKGFEGGKLQYESKIFKGESNSNLLITDFKVSKVPALAKLLTLASLQGIADTLSGEGIRFDSFEMKSNTKGNILNIEDALAMGSAVSILLNGYVDKGKIVSLRGTLVPATKLNSIIAKIPLVGNILVGKKTGEGVVGVSFKMKGPPKNIKTTVNPIKTLTPRFIIRAIDKMKKKKKRRN